MRQGQIIVVIIPTLNEELAIGKVIDAIPKWVDHILVCDNQSTDQTRDIAEKRGATVLTEDQTGYGSACYRGVHYCEVLSPSIVVFLDGDFSDYPEEMSNLVDPIVKNQASFVIGSRTTRQMEGLAVEGNLQEMRALPIQARLGNWLACFLITIFWSTKYTDLGPFRAIRFKLLQDFRMQDRRYGWTVEMQVKAAHAQSTILEVPVKYRCRIGKSKITGTVGGSIKAGTDILKTIFLLRKLLPRRK